jgi:predicted O-methyltransferase YrrM
MTEERHAAGAAWYRGKDFSNDWLSAYLPVWTELFAPCAGRVATMLEIGAWEGRSAIALLELFPRAVLTVVDTFAGSPNHRADPAMRETLARLEARFDANLASYEGRLRKIRDRSAAALDRLADGGFAFDLIHVDGSHRRDDTLADCVLAWRLLRTGGLLVIDDIRFRLEWPPAERPADAVAMVEAMFGGCWRELHRGRQLIVEKEAEWPERFHVGETGRLA